MVSGAGAPLPIPINTLRTALQQSAQLGIMQLYFQKIYKLTIRPKYIKNRHHII